MSLEKYEGGVYRSSCKIHLGRTRGKRAEVLEAEGDTSVKKKGKKEQESPEVAPELIVKPRRQFIDDGGDAKFKASFDGSNNTTLFWSKDGNVLSQDDHFKMYEVDGYHFLEVLNAKVEDNGIYSVTVQNSAGSDTASADLEVFEKPKLLTRSGPTWEQPLQDLTVEEEEEEVELACTSRELIKPSVKWYHNSKEVFSGFHVKLRHEGQTASLIIKEIRDRDAGEFKCVMAGSNGELETSCVMTVKSPGRMEPPVFVKELHDMEVEEGDKLELDVEVKGTPPVGVYWYHNNVEITHDNPHFLLAALGHVHTLTLPRTTSECSGEYVCEAYNDYGDTDTFCLIDVKEVEHPEPPDFITRPLTLTTCEGETATFTCQVKGQPKPSVMWERDGIVIATNQKYKTTRIQDRHTLTIFNTDPMDGGDYICHLHSPVGETSHVCTLHVTEATTRNSEEGSLVKARLIHVTEVQKRLPLSQESPDKFATSSPRMGSRRSHGQQQPQPQSWRDKSATSQETAANTGTSVKEDNTFQSKHMLNKSAEESSKKSVTYRDSGASQTAHYPPLSSDQERGPHKSIRSSTVRGEVQQSSGKVSISQTGHTHSATQASRHNTHKYNSPLLQPQDNSSRLRHKFENQTDRGSDFRSQDISLQFQRKFEQQTFPDNDFRSVLHKSHKNKEEKIGRNHVKKSENGITDFRCVLKQKKTLSASTQKSSRPESGETALSKSRIHEKADVQVDIGDLKSGCFRSEVSVLHLPMSASSSTHSSSAHPLQQDLGHRPGRAKIPKAGQILHGADTMNGSADSGQVLDCVNRRNGSAESVSDEPVSSQRQSWRQSRKSCTLSPLSSTPFENGLNMTDSDINVAAAGVSGIGDDIKSEELAGSNFHDSDTKQVICQSELEIAESQTLTKELKATAVHQRSEGKFEVIFSYTPQTVTTSEHLMTGVSPSEHPPSVSSGDGESSVSSTLKVTSKEISARQVSSYTFSPQVPPVSKSSACESEAPSYVMSSSLTTSQNSSYAVAHATGDRHDDDDDDVFADTETRESPQHHANTQERLSSFNSFGSVYTWEKPPWNPEDSTGEEDTQAKQIVAMREDFDQTIGAAISEDMSSHGGRRSFSKNQDLFAAGVRETGISSVTETEPRDFRKVKLRPRSAKADDINKELWNSKSKSTSTESIFTEVKLKHVSKNDNLAGPQISAYTIDTRAKSKSSVMTKDVTVSSWTLPRSKTRPNTNSPSQQSSRSSHKLLTSNLANHTEYQQSKLLKHGDTVSKFQGKVAHLDSEPIPQRQSKGIGAKFEEAIKDGKNASGHKYAGSKNSDPDYVKSIKADTCQQWKTSATVHNRKQEPKILGDIGKSHSASNILEHSSSSNLHQVPGWIRQKDKSYSAQMDTSSTLPWSSKRTPVQEARDRPTLKEESPTTVRRLRREQETTKADSLKRNSGFKSSAASTGLANSTVSSAGKLLSKASHISASDPKPEWLNRKTLNNIEAKIKSQAGAKLPPQTCMPVWVKLKDRKKTDAQERTSALIDSALVHTDPHQTKEEISSLFSEKSSVCSDAGMTSGISSLHSCLITTTAKSDNQAPSDLDKVSSAEPDTSISALAASSSASSVGPSTDLLPSKNSSDKEQPELVFNSTAVAATAKESAQASQKNTVVKPSWMRQKSLRHIPIYPIHDNNFSTHYEPFKSSMDDSESIISTTSISSLSSDASNMTNDSGYPRNRFKLAVDEDRCHEASEFENTHNSCDISSEKSQDYLETDSTEASSNEHSQPTETVRNTLTCDQSNSCGARGQRTAQDNVSSGRVKTETSEDRKKVPNTPVHDLELPRQTEEMISDNFHPSSKWKSNESKASDSGPDFGATTRRRQHKINVQPSLEMASVQAQSGEAGVIGEFAEKLDNLEFGSTISGSEKSQNVSDLAEKEKSSVMSSQLAANLHKGSALTSQSKYNSHCKQTPQEPLLRSGECTSYHDVEAQKEELSKFAQLRSKFRDPDEKSCPGNGTGTQSRFSAKRPSDLDIEPKWQSSRTRPRDVKQHEAAAGTVNGETVTTCQQCPPSFITPLRDLSIMFGARAVLRCQVTANPRPHVRWMLEHTPIEPSKNTELSYVDSVAQLIVHETFTEHVGEYTCRVSNPLGILSSHCRLTLETVNKSEGRAFEGPVCLPPRIVSLTPKIASVTRKSALALTVNFVGEPTPQVKWLFAGKELTTDGNIDIETENNTSVLTILSVDQSHVGKMSVCITSCIGTDQASSTVCIEDVPGAPVGAPHVYDIGCNSASLSWCGPTSNGGSPITYFIIEAKTKHQKSWDVIVPQCKEQSCHIFELKPSTTYQFRVRAANKHGLGAPSEPSEKVITSDAFKSPSDYDSEDVFSPTIEFRGQDELPFEPRDVRINSKDKFEDLYELEKEVGKGKFGVVYKCRQKTGDGRVWAAKMIKCREKEKVNIRQEIEIMNKLRHPKLLLLWDAFESPRQIVLVMEYIGAGELFERVVGEDFVLTERDCVHFMRQICEGVSYMHKNCVLHLDLKPENILCIAENSNRIKIIDFGLARVYHPGDSVKVMFGTPEFIAPEVINFDEIDFTTDMWSIGVICYVLLSGLSPFLEDTDHETLASVTSGEFDFDDEAFDEISDPAKDFISKLLLKKKENRMLTENCLAHDWLNQDEVDGTRYKRLNTERLKRFMVRRKWLKTGNAVLAVSRLLKSSSLSSFGSLSHSTSIDSNPETPSQNSSPPNLLLLQLTTEEEEEAIVQEMDDNEPYSLESNLSEPSERQTDNTHMNKSSLYNQNEANSASDTHSGNEKIFETGCTNSSNLHQNENQMVGHCSSPLPQAITDINQNADNSQITAVQDLSLSSSSCAPASSLTDALKDNIGNTAETSSNNNCFHQPVFLRSMAHCKACAGDVARFDVIVSGNPPPKILWYFEDEEVHTDPRHIIDSNERTNTFSLIIRSIEDEDEGEYTCKAVNSQGECTCVAELSVLEL